MGANVYEVVNGVVELKVNSVDMPQILAISLDEDINSKQYILDLDTDQIILTKYTPLESLSERISTQAITNYDMVFEFPIDVAWLQDN